MSTVISESMIYSLPTELLSDIASFLSSHDLFRVALVSRKWRDIAEPHLYHTYRSPSMSSARRRDGRPSGPPFRLFLRRLIEQPDFAVNVRRLDLQRWSTLFNIQIPGFLPPNPSQEDLQAALTAAKACKLVSEDASLDLGLKEGEVLFPKLLGFSGAAIDPTDGKPWQEKWLRQLHAGLDDPLVILMVALLHRVEEIRIDENPFKSLSWQVLENVPHGFAHLRKLWISSAQTTFPGYASLLSSPAMQVFESWNTTDDHNRTTWTFPASSSPVREVILESFYVQSSTLNSLIQCFKALTTFSLYIDNFMDHNTVSQLPKIANYLVSHKATLRHLRLEAARNAWAEQLNLRDFDEVYVLAVSTSFSYRSLQETSCPFPASLRSLLLVLDNFNAGASGFQEYLEHLYPMLGYMPFLKRIDFEIRQGSMYMNDLETFKSRCSSHDVQVEWYDSGFWSAHSHPTLDKFRSLVKGYGVSGTALET